MTDINNICIEPDCNADFIEEFVTIFMRIMNEIIVAIGAKNHQEQVQLLTGLFKHVNVAFKDHIDEFKTENEISFVVLIFEKTMEFEHVHCANCMADVDKSLMDEFQYELTKSRGTAAGIIKEFIAGRRRQISVV